MLCPDDIKIAKVNAEAEHVLQRGAKRRFDCRIAAGCFHCDAQTRMRGRADLLNGEFNDRRINGADAERAAIGFIIPAVENIFRATPKGPDGKVQTKRRRWAQEKGAGLVREWRCGVRSRGKHCREASRVPMHVVIIYRSCGNMQMQAGAAGVTRSPEPGRNKRWERFR